MSVTGAQWAELPDALKAQTEATTAALQHKLKHNVDLKVFESLASHFLPVIVPTPQHFKDLHHKNVGADDVMLDLCKENSSKCKARYARNWSSIH